MSNRFVMKAACLTVVDNASVLGLIRPNTNQLQTGRRMQARPGKE